MAWFLRPLYSKLRSAIRPPTARTCRKLVEVKVPLPMDCFQAFMKPYEDDPDIGVERGEDGLIKPTSSGASSNYFRYLLTKPTKYDKLFSLDTLNNKKVPRSLGCANLVISPAALKQGYLAESVSLPFGNVSLVYCVPKHDRSMPTLTMRFFVMTMTATGMIRWPFEVNTRTKHMLRTMARIKVKEMLESEKPYPISPLMWESLVKVSSTLETYQTSRARPAPLRNPRTPSLYLNPMSTTQD